MLTNRTIVIVVIAFILLSAFVLINRPTGQGTVVEGRVIGICSAPQGRKQVGQLECWVALDDGNRESFRTQTPYAEGYRLEYIRRDRRIIGYHYERASKRGMFVDEATAP